jgi:FkbM family methyltransferase
MGGCPEYSGRTTDGRKPDAQPVAARRKVLSRTFTERIGRFLRKSPQEKWLTIRFFANTNLSRLPYAPHRVRLLVPPAESVSFWWSYVPPDLQPERHWFDYWGDDIGELRFLWRFLRPGMTFVDIGAYHGVYTVVAAKKLAKQGSVVAFEPSERERRRLRLHLQLNRLSEVMLENYAIGSRRETLNLYKVVAGPTSMNSLRRPEVSAPVVEIPIETIPLDDYLRQTVIDRIDLVKIDTEGGELEVFGGAEWTLISLRPLLICEVLDWVTRPWGYYAREIVTRLEKCDYEWFEFRRDGTLLPHQRREAYLEVRNYLAVPRERRSVIEEWVRL